MNSSNLELKITVGTMISTGIVGVLWWLWRKYRVRRPPPKQEQPK